MGNLHRVLFLGNRTSTIFGESGFDWDLYMTKFYSQLRNHNLIQTAILSKKSFFRYKRKQAYACILSSKNLKFFSLFHVAVQKFLRMIDWDLSAPPVAIIIYSGKIKNIGKLSCYESQTFGLVLIVLVWTTNERNL